MAPKRKAPAPAAKEENGKVVEIKKRGRPPGKAKAAPPPPSSSSEQSEPAVSAEPITSPVKKKPGRKPKAAPKAAPKEKSVLKEKAAPEKPAAKEKAAPKAKATPKEKIPAKKKTPPAKKVKKSKEEEEEDLHEDEGVEEAPVPEIKTAKATNGVEKSVIIEHCRQCTSFKTRALKVQDAIKLAIPGLQVSINPEKPRKGCFEIRDSDGTVFVSLQDMPRPFTKMKALNLDDLAADIVTKLA